MVEVGVEVEEDEVAEEKDVVDEHQKTKWHN
jgi:hypothetical protein